MHHDQDRKFAVVHFSVAFLVGYSLSGSVLVGGVIALVEPAINTAAYYLHEQRCDRFGRRWRSGGAGAMLAP